MVAHAVFETEINLKFWFKIHKIVGFGLFQCLLQQELNYSSSFSERNIVT